MPIAHRAIDIKNIPITNIRLRLRQLATDGAKKTAKNYAAVTRQLPYLGDMPPPPDSSWMSSNICYEYTLIELTPVA